MMQMPPSSSRLLLVAAIALGLAACGKSGDNSEAPAASSTAASMPAPAGTAAAPMTPTRAPVPASSTMPVPATSSAQASPAANAPLSVSKVTLGNSVGKDYMVTKASERFEPDDHTLYAAVSTEGAATGATLAAHWTYEDGQTVNDMAQSITADGTATTTFKVHNPNDWPTGKYKVAISLDGKAVASKDFEVAKR